jgi:hemoglobin
MRWMEAGRRDAATGADVVLQAPVPHWGWGVAPPYQP